MVVKWNKIAVVAMISYLGIMGNCYSFTPEEIVLKCELLTHATSVKHKKIYKPKIFQEINNLTRTTAELLRDESKDVYIIGKFVDKNCVPVPDIQLKIWQGNKGDKKDKSYVYSPSNKLDYSKGFVGTGMAKTDNLGEVLFITNLPPKSSNYNENYMVTISHPIFGDATLKLQLDMVETELLSNYDREAGWDTGMGSGSNVSIREFMESRGFNNRIVRPLVPQHERKYPSHVLVARSYDNGKTFYFDHVFGKADPYRRY